MKLMWLSNMVQTYAAVVMVTLGPYVGYAFSKGHDLPKSTVIIRSVNPDEEDPLRSALDNERRKWALLRYLMISSATDQKAHDVWNQQETVDL